MAKATITAAAPQRYNVNEGNPAISTFNFSQALDNTAEVQIRLTGIAATKGANKDYDGFYYRSGTGAAPTTSTLTNSDLNGWTLINGNSKTVALNKDDTWIQLGTKVFDDDKAGEQNESLVFSLAQAPSASKVLENSYYVTSTANIRETLSFAKITVDKAWYDGRMSHGNAYGLLNTPDGSSLKYTFDESSANAGPNSYYYAIGAFKLSTALNRDAQIAVKVEGQGATIGQDTVLNTFEYQIAQGNPGYMDGAWIPVPTDGKITLTNGATNFKLRVALTGDNTSEPTEQLNFSVRQLNGNLKDSYYVNVVADVRDQQINTNNLTATINPDSLGGTPGQDQFNMVNANSKPFAVNHDTITNFGTGDVIKLPEAVQRYSIGEVSLNEFQDTYTGLFDALNNGKYDENFPNGTGSILKIVESATTVWLLIDTNADGVMNTRLRSTGNQEAGDLTDQYDTLIKVVGSVNSAGDIVSEQLTGERFITE